MSFNFESLLAEYDRKVEELNAAKEKMQKELAAQLEPLFKEFFKENPKIGKIAWTQYTPYFNDGEPCEFSVHEKYFVATKWLEEDEDDPIEYQDCPSLWSYGNKEASFYDSDVDSFKKAGLTEEEIKKVEAFGRFLDNIPEDIYEGIYGDHVEIIATAEGVEVNDYEHD